MSTKDTVAVASRLPPLNLGTVERQVQQTGAYSALEEPLDPVDFPAWLLLREPGLLHHLDRVDTPVPEGAAFLAMVELLRNRVRGADEVSARKRLQQISSSLLRAYLQRKAG